VFLQVSDPSQVSEARRRVCHYATSVGLPQEYIDRAAIVVTELATNLVKHAGGGHIHARQFEDAGGTGLELLALDRGPGMTDVGRCMEDGYSTAGSPGTGLGAIQRLTNEVRIYSRPAQGSAVLARIPIRASGGSGVALGAALAPYPGEQVCGDAWSFVASSCGPTMVLADGSGHGVEAARAAEIGLRSFADNANGSCEAIVEAMHLALGPTRGAAVAVARIDTAAHVVRFVGVGNIGALLVHADGTRHMVSHNGVAGHVAPRIREFVHEYSRNPLVILYSDGVATRWDLASYPGLALQHPSLIAGVLLRDHRRGRDDASVVAMRPLG
jgi:anti-sigma regulatory factor (Ser/Thr protein kinase)